MAVFPGDAPFKEEFSLHMKRGDNLTLSKIETTVHLGAHTDAPSHYSLQGESMESRDLHYYMGPAQVIEIKNVTGGRILPHHIEGVTLTAERVLFKTMSYRNPYLWNENFMALSSQLVQYLADKKVKLVGIDTPSIDPARDEKLESHQEIFKQDMAILEGIVLEHVPEGVYNLIALPLKIEGADASPVRAILLKT